MGSTGFVYHDGYLEHETGRGHPERRERLVAIVNELERSGLLSELVQHTPDPAESSRVAAIHSPEHIARIEAACQRGPALLDAADTVVGPTSFRAGLLAVGGVLESIDAVMAGRWSNGFVCSRPPGHHAERNAAMGFCLFNQIAIGAKYLRQHHGLERVAIVDFDVHHGNGTQHAFERDPSVYYVSLHEWPLYPGTGTARERGEGLGDGTTLNCPLPSRSGDLEWLNAIDQQVLPELESFKPQFLLLSAGFDAHRDDPLSSTHLTEQGYREITERLTELAKKHCEGRLVSVLEGGYDLSALASSVRTHLEVLSHARAPAP